MPISQILLTANSGPRYIIFAEANGELGASIPSAAFSFTGINIPAGTYYWTIDTNAGDFVTSSGELGNVPQNTGTYTFSWEGPIIADETTEGPETFTVSVRLGSVTGPIVATSDPVTIEDTSTTPAAEPPFSLQFDQPQGDYLSTPANADWNLGTSWTIEFWLKANSSGYSGNPRMSGDIWGLLNQGGWGTTNSINIAISDAKLVFLSGSNAYEDVRYTEPTPNQWTHVAIVNNAGTQTVWYNGSEQTKVSGTFGTANYANSTDSLAIGTLSGGNNYFDGKMAMVRISNTAKYSAPFTPTVTYGVDADTKLFLSSDAPLVDLSYYELNGVATVTSAGDTLYFSKATYPNLNNQIRPGNTVVNVDGSGASTSTTTGEVFTPNGDPNNWAVTIFPSQGGGTKNFSGARPRNAITNNGVTQSTTFVNRYTATHPVVNGGSTNPHIDSNPSNDAWAATVPQGARIISSVTGRFVLNAVPQISGSGTWLFVVGGSNNFTAGETHTFIW